MCVLVIDVCQRFNVAMSAPEMRRKSDSLTSGLPKDVIGKLLSRIATACDGGAVTIGGDNISTPMCQLVQPQKNDPFSDLVIEEITSGRFVTVSYF